MKSYAVGVAIAVLATMGVAEAQTPSPPSATAEGTGSGSGSSGMAPQQGTGSGATQHAPGANRPEAGNAPAGESPQNRDYGRETTPSGQPMHQSNPADSVKRPD
ncbi:hypothetical protein [Shinella sp.]|uniref:hypothetical protein n=1 Tax=Shinella sp. TaxID=1870904 RepID=UPI00301E1DD8